MFIFALKFGFYRCLGGRIKRESGENPELFPQL